MFSVWYASFLIDVLPSSEILLYLLEQGSAIFFFNPHKGFVFIDLEGARNIHQLPPVRAPTGDLIYSLLVYEMTLQPTEPTPPGGSANF